MKRFPTWAVQAAIVFLGVAFAVGNAGRVVSINLGFVTLSRVPVTFVAFGGMVVGMGIVLVAGINADLKVRRLLRERSDPESVNGGSSRRTAHLEDEQGDMRLE